VTTDADLRPLVARNGEHHHMPIARAVSEDCDDDLVGLEKRRVDR
jgi:hypothetical protein